MRPARPAIGPTRPVRGELGPVTLLSRRALFNRKLIESGKPS